WKMLSLHYCVMFPLLMITLKGVNCQQLTVVKDEESSLEGSTVTLTYNNSQQSSSNYFFWYRQHSGKPPEFLISHLASGKVGTRQISGLQIHVEEKQISMKISSAAVSDSAVYYCAVKPTVTGNSKTLYKNLWNKDNRKLHSIH
uniref:Ig-like domain-containing protein n=1 Tax=Amphiprion ocellaris TaxID=80972 RepID=A0AAQ5X6Y3_AMPOC